MNVIQKCNYEELRSDYWFIDSRNQDFIKKKIDDNVRKMYQ